MILAVAAALLVLRNATVIDGTGAPPRPATDVVIRDGRIAAVQPTGRPPAPGATVIDATGKFVIPGLVDMHAHVFPDPPDANGNHRLDRPSTLHMLPTFLRFGVTTVHDPGAPTAEAVLLRRLLAEGKVEGPTLFTAGSILNASDFSPPGFQPVKDEAAVREEVRWQAAAGVDTIKVYSSMPPSLVAAAIDEAHKRGLRVVGHVQRTTWTEAARLGIDGLEHAAPWSSAYVRERDRDGMPNSMFGRVYWLQHLDPAAIDEMVREIKAHGVTVDPTLMAMHTKFWGNDPRYTESADNQFAPPKVLATWPAGRFTADWTPEQYAEARKAWPTLLGLTKKLYDAGVRLVAGTDTATPWIVPGASLHDELRLLADAGIPPLAILRIATYNAASALRREKEFGSIAPGLRADLVVLDRNPLDDIANTRSIAMVLQRGRIVHDAKTDRRTH